MSAHPASRRTYYTVAAVLMMLVVVTIAAAKLELGPLGPVVALTIAGTKAVLVALYFMHLNVASAVTKLFAASGLLWLAILIALTTADFVTRAV